jgi:hypothetical protein
MRRLLVGAVLGGLVLFVWGAVSHEMLPLGRAGLRTLSPEQETAVLLAMRGAMNERALYIFPGLDPSRPMSAADQTAWTEKWLAGPGGIVAFDPHPGERAWAGSLFTTLFATELLTNVLAALVAGFVLLHVPASVGYARRVLVTAALGLLVTLDVEASYWNWYGFPTGYFLAQLADHTLGWLLAGLVLARVIRSTPVA